MVSQQLQASDVMVHSKLPVTGMPGSAVDGAHTTGAARAGLG